MENPCLKEQRGKGLGGAFLPKFVWVTVLITAIEGKQEQLSKLG